MKKKTLFHTLISLLLCNAMYQHHHNVHGYIIDTTSVPAAAKSLKILVKGEDERSTVLQMIKGEDSSSESVMQMFQGLTYPRFPPKLLLASLLVILCTTASLMRKFHVGDELNRWW